MYKEILFAQFDDRVRRGLAAVIDLYSKFLNDEITPEEFKGMVEMTKGIALIFQAMQDIKNGEAEQYKHLVYTLAHEEE